jgi:EAL domain-containing protein (putative c-di-GMP-specific phosphodiesterase class I)
MGIVTYPHDGNSFNELLKSADIAMYYAKEHGKSRYEFFTKIMNDKVSEKSDMEKDLRQAIKHNEFVVYYQPQINLFTGELDGMEALVRWLHPKKGLISPLKFIPLAEETGLIIEIGNMVLLEACKQNIKWQNDGYKPLRISVNLSVKQFEQEELIEIIDKILKETGMSSKWLDLEITESIVMTNFNFSINMINNLRNMGIHISLDDFGTGYSSLNYLKMFPIDSLKIDKSFLDNLAVDSNEEIIARAIIELAHKMKFDVVAEGVEHSKQLKFLREHSCDKAQGFLFSKPITKDEFEELLKSNNIFC